MNLAPKMAAPNRFPPIAQYDAVVVGAGPYGLSTAVHLLARGLRVAVFGKPLELWRDHMPRGMMLRSHWWATNLSDPGRQYGFERFFRESGYRESFPVPLETFIDYGLWFRERTVPHVDETYVASIRRDGDHFVLALADGRTVHSATVVMAIGVYYYAHRPEEFGHLPPDLASHSCRHSDLGRFEGQQVLIVGGGASGTDCAALLQAAGARVHVVTHRPILWFGPDRTNERTIRERILAPNNAIAPGWPNWILEHCPYLFNVFSQDLKDRYNSNYVSGATDWLRKGIIGKVTLHEGHRVVTASVIGGEVDAAISDGTRVRADHVILATGYRVDIGKLTMIDPSLLREIKTDRSIPLLNRRFESSVPGLYFVGLTSVRAFGPLYRFVVGCHPTARRVAHAISRMV